MQKFRQWILVGGLLGLMAACSGDTVGASQAEAKVCSTALDCTAGGSCQTGECVADNACTTASDCLPTEVCSQTPDFGGVCHAPTLPPQGLPAAACTDGKDCPLGQGCGDDGLCHVDGECLLAWDCSSGECYLESDDCAPGSVCSSGSPAGTKGFCATGRGGTSPYCRSDGLGACRGFCTVDDECWQGTCNTEGFCVGNAECQSNSDCGPGQECAPQGQGYTDYGISLCETASSNPCVNDPNGVCRTPCTTDLQCIDGGGCEADNLCHASNECDAQGDCPVDQICYASTHFGGLCGPPRP